MKLKVAHSNGLNSEVLHCILKGCRDHQAAVADAHPATVWGASQGAWDT